MVIHIEANLLRNRICNKDKFETLKGKAFDPKIVLLINNLYIKCEEYFYRIFFAFYV